MVLRRWFLGMAGLLVCVAARPGIPSVRINEFMASNQATYQDPQGGFADWIELYNDSDAAVDVAGLYLTDDLVDPTKWRIPKTSPQWTRIAPHGFLVIWADGNTADPGLYAGFSLKADGEEIGLYDETTHTFLDYVAFGGQVPDVSFGRLPDGSGSWQYMAEPTPWMENRQGWLGLVQEVGFSQARGFYDAPIRLELSCPTDGAQVWYTLDAQTPTGLDTQTGTRYTGPILIDHTTCVRAVAVMPGWRSSEVRSHTYVFLKDVIRQGDRPVGFPTTWGGNRVDYAMDPRVVDDPAYAGTIQEDLKSIPSVCIVLPNEDLFGDKRGIYANAGKRHDPEKGQDWERAASMEWIDPRSGDSFGVNAGLRTYGGNYSRASGVAKHGFRFLFKAAYGPTKLRYPLFPDSPVEQFDTLILRSIWNYSWTGHSGMGTENADYLRDAFCSDTVQDMGHLAAHERYVHLYLNGLYWGLYVLLERPDADFACEHLGDGAYDVIKPGDTKGAPMEVMAGDLKAWNDLFALALQDPSKEETYRRMEAGLDTSGLIDYMLMVFCVGSRDGPTWLNDNRYPHNFYGLASRDPAGPFRFLPWDMEWVLESPGENRVKAVGGQNNPGLLFKAMGAHPEFRLLVADLIHRHLFNGGSLTPPRMAERYLARAAEIDRAIVGESARWGDCLRAGRPYTRDVEWVAERDRLVHEYFPPRTQIVLDQLRAAGWYPAVDAPEFEVLGEARHGGYASKGDPLMFVSPIAAGRLHYSLDGTDPRLASESPLSTTIGLTKSVRVKARLWTDQWSALTDAVFSVGPLAQSLRISEIMYHPAEPNAEFIELANIGSEPINLSLVRLVDGVEHAFGDVDVEPGRCVVLVQNRSVFESTYGPGLPIAGEYRGSLSNDGESVEIQDALGATLLKFQYNDSWYRDTDGAGRSLGAVDLTHQDPARLSGPDAWQPIVPSPGLVQP